MSEPGSLRKVFHQWGGTTAALFAYIHGSHDMCGGLLPAFIPVVKIALGLSYLQSGLLLSAFTITSGFSQILGGWLGDRSNRYLLAAIGLGGVGLGTLAIGLSSTYYPLLVVLIVMGVFAGAYHPAATPILSSYFDGARRGKVLAFHLVGGSGGLALGPIIGGLIVAVLGWRPAFIILSIPALVAVILILRESRHKEHLSDAEPVREAPTTNEPLIKPNRSWASIGRALRPVAFVTTLVVLTQFIAGAALVFIPVYLVDEHNIAPAYAVMLVGLVRSGGMLGSLLGGWLSDRWGRMKANFLVLVATGPILYLFTMLPFNPLNVVVLILFGLLMFMRQSTIQPLLMDSTPPELRSTVFGIYFGLSMEGMSLMQPVAGYFMDIYGIVEVFNVIALMSVALSVVALLLAKRGTTPGTHNNSSA